MTEFVIIVTQFQETVSVEERTTDKTIQIPTTMESVTTAT